MVNKPVNHTAGGTCPPGFMSTFAMPPFLTRAAYFWGIFCFRQFDQRGLDFPVVKTPKVTRYKGFWGLRRQKWDFMGFNIKIRGNRKKQENTAEIRQKSEKS